MLIAPRPGGGILDKIFPENYQAAPAKTYELGTVEITATDTPDANPTVNVIGKDEIERTGSLDVSQALRRTPGLYTITTATGSPAFYIRGFDERDLGYYLDGIPVNDIYTGNAAAATDLSAFFTFGLSQIEVSKGYTSPAFSMGKLGGAVNMVTSVPTKDLEFKIGYRFIANNEHRTNIQVGRNLGDKYFQITFSHMERDSLNYSYDHSWEGPVDITYNGFSTSRRGYMISGKYGWIIGDDHEYSVNFYHQHQKMRGSQPANFSFPYYDKTGFYVLGDSKFNELFSLNSKLWYHMNTNVGKFWGNNVSGSKYNDYSLGLTETAKFSFTQDQNLKVGVMLKNDNHEALDTNYEVPKRKWKILNSSLFAEYAIRANDLFRFVLSGSWERHDGLNLKTTNSNTTEQVKQPNKHLNGWNLQGIAYMNLSDFGLLHFNVGHKSQIPKIRYIYSDGGIEAYGNSYIYVVGNDSLKPESIVNFELGGDFDFKFEQVGTLKFGATGFYNYIDNMIYSVSHSGTAQCGTSVSNNAISGTCVQYTNAKNGYSYGAEIYVNQGFFGDTLTLGANYGFTERRSFDRNTNGDKSATREFLLHPKHYINLSAIIIPAKEYDISLMGTLLPKHKRYANYSNNTTENVATVFYADLEANYYLKENLKLTVGAYNLFDKDYIFDGTIEASINHPRRGAGIAGRRVFAGIEYSY